MITAFAYRTFLSLVCDGACSPAATISVEGETPKDCFAQAMAQGWKVQQSRHYCPACEVPEILLGQGTTITQNAKGETIVRWAR